MDHPADEVLRRFAALEGSRQENRLVVQHLLAKCAECAAKVREAFRPQIDPAEHDAALSRVFDSFLEPPRRQGPPAKLLPFEKPDGPRATGCPGGSGARPPVP
jgi:hypothetical protein